MIRETEFGRIEVVSIPLPSEWQNVFGTYTASGRVLVTYELPGEEKDFFHLVTMNDDGTEIKTVFEGLISVPRTANGIRWMCCSDNQRILTGDYVIEVSPDLDHPESACLLPVRYPAELMTYPKMFRHWSEPNIAPDGVHIGWTMLTFSGAANFLGNLIRKDTEYVIENARCISSKSAYIPDPDHSGYVLPQPMRGGEMKQFIHGGRAIALVGNSDSVADSVIEELDTGKTEQFTHTSGYEETAIFSPDETLALCMSTRFSPATDCSILGTVPLPHSMMVRGGITNAAYMYAIASARSYRSGNIGPALVDVKRTQKEGRAYEGVDLHDPDNRFVYYSPMSWSPCSTKALWPEKTRLNDPDHAERLQVVKLLDRKPSQPIPAVRTPEPEEVPYALTLEEFLKEEETLVPPFKIAGTAGEITFEITSDGWKKETYENYSPDGETFYNGIIAAKAPQNIFAGGDSIFTGDLAVTGAHAGELKATVIFRQPGPDQPAFLAPESEGYAIYDGKSINVKDMAE